MQFQLAVREVSAQHSGPSGIFFKNMVHGPKKVENHCLYTNSNLKIQTLTPSNFKN